MNFFAGFLGAAFAKIFEFFGAWVGKKVALGAAIAASFLAILAVFYLAITAAVAGLVSTVSNTWFIQGFYLLYPDNATLCISAYYSARVAKMVYEWHADMIKAVATVS